MYFQEYLLNVSLKPTIEVFQPAGWKKYASLSKGTTYEKMYHKI